jgi:hypothetical protein
MHVHLPKPLHGWRAFIGEVGIIVLGVLIALSAEQFVEVLHWRSEVDVTRQALRAELGRDVGIMDFDNAQGRCIDRRLDQLENWLAASRAGHDLIVVHPIGRPSQYSIASTVWDTAKSGEVAGHMRVKERLVFAHAYDQLDNVARLLERQRDGWWALSQFNDARKLDHGDQMRLEQLIATLRSIREIMAVNARLVHGWVGPMKLTVEHVPVFAAEADRSFCEPLFQND